MFDTIKPKLIEAHYPGYAIRFNLEPGTGQENEPGWNYDEVRVPNLYYSTIVSAIIHHRYPVDAEIALLNNHLTDPEPSADEWAEYQSWRGFAKDYVKMTLGVEE
ncbi:MAG: hypothetical protein PHC50_04350 [Candidatus Cloacimonetes bacterium]|nr:hypothetical protein [Candidatus Cloacimonadota bacterium]